ncbi:MAG: uncharacterized protein KVP18_003300 [Porospora cf. gigantea A]|nr:MAG: hypothetical protein KVP18_003300 [Porospora cf. gigantea A]
MKSWSSSAADPKPYRESSPFKRAVSGAASLTTTSALQDRSRRLSSVEEEQNWKGPALQAVVLVVDFDHTHGPVIEHVFPSHLERCVINAEREPLVYVERDAMPAEPPPEDWYSDIGSVAHAIPFLALPDVAHNAENQRVALALPTPHGRILFGVSSCRRLHLQVSDSQRPFALKAVCAVSPLPCWSTLISEVERAADAFVGSQFQCLSAVSGLFASIPLCSGYFQEIPLNALKAKFKIKSFFTVQKALMLQLRVLVYSDSPSEVSEAVLALLNLLPGLGNFGLKAEDEARRKSLGLPLSILGPDFPVFPYVGLQHHEDFATCKGWLVGCTNRVFLSMTSLEPDITINLVDSTLTVGKTSQAALQASEYEVRLSKRLKLMGRPSDKSSPKTGRCVESLLPRVVRGFCTSNLVTDDSIDDENGCQMLEEGEETRVYHFFLEVFLRMCAFKLGPSKSIPSLLESGKWNLLQDFNPLFVRAWTQTENFSRWLDSQTLDPFPVFVRPPRMGTARYTYTNGDLYEGSFSNSLRQGKGCYSALTGIKYEGDWCSDERHGKGVLFDVSTGYMYTGDWVHDQKSGQGHLYNNHERYWGSFALNRFHGQGTHKDSFGNQYVGEFFGGCFHGNGTLSRQSGEVLKGEWSNGKMQGRGSRTFVDGRRYDGDFDCHRFHGYGVMLFPDGSSFEGQWGRGRRNGDGHMRVPDGDGYLEIEGVWTVDVPDASHSQWSLMYPDGDSYCGEIRVFHRGSDVSVDTWKALRLTEPASPSSLLQVVRNCTGQPAPELPVILPHGKGTAKMLTTADVFDGQFFYGMCHGQGEFFSHQGWRYRGDWMFGNMHGAGSVVEETGKVEIGFFRAGLLKMTEEARLRIALSAPLDLHKPPRLPKKPGPEDLRRDEWAFMPCFWTSAINSSPYVLSSNTEAAGDDLGKDTEFLEDPDLQTMHSRREAEGSPQESIDGPPLTAMETLAPQSAKMERKRRDCSPYGDECECEL